MPEATFKEVYGRLEVPRSSLFQLAAASDLSFGTFWGTGGEGGGESPDRLCLEKMRLYPHPGVSGLVSRTRAFVLPIPPRKVIVGDNPGLTELPWLVSIGTNSSSS